MADADAVAAGTHADPEIAGTTAVVTGASRGFGRAIAEALHGAGAHVVGLARDAAALSDLQEQLGDRFTAVVADAADPVTAGSVVERYRPTTLVLNAGATPLNRPIHQHTWETFNRAWEVDVRQAFHWLREALLLPLAPGSTVISMSSGAALNGSPLSGGYAGAKATVRFVTGYAAEESARSRLDIRFLSVLPRLTPATDLGVVAVAAYATRAGLEVAEFLDGFGPTLTPGDVGKAIVDLATSPAHQPGGYLLTAAGLSVVP
jgi:NAD(P)-dependent dehydrogenase (short-subunit alcohol dehydrogenase family)